MRVAYETTDSYSAQEYAQRKREILKEIEKLEDGERAREQQIRERDQQRDALLFVRALLPHVDVWMESAPAGEVSVQLSRAVERVVVNADKSVSVTLW